MMIKPLPLSLSFLGIISLAQLACYRPLMNHKESVLFNCGETIGSFLFISRISSKTAVKCSSLVLSSYFGGIITAASSVSNSPEASKKRTPQDGVLSIGAS